jgi:NAD-reducing hydrogenase large subunit
MLKEIVIDPVTRIEGHSKITIQLDDQGEVQDAKFHVTQFRGFEKFCEGRPFAEMPSLTARTCGICPVSHLMASAKACDALLAVEIPPTAAKLRRIMNLAQLVQSHALSFFYLSSPDLLLGMDADPSKRNILGIVEAHPTLARDGIALRKFGQEIIAMLDGKRIHPAWAVPGGVSEPLSEEKRAKILAMIPEASSLIERTLSWFKSVLEQFRDEVQRFGNFPTMFMA